MTNAQVSDERPATTETTRPVPVHPDAPDLPDGAFSRERIVRVLRDRHRKSLPRMASEIAALWKATGRRPAHYLRRFLYRTGVETPHGFLSEADEVALWRYVSRSEAAGILDDKVRFAEYFGTVPGLILPRQLGHTKDRVLHLEDGSTRELETAEDLTAAVEAWRRATDGSAVFAKPLGGYRSMGLFRISNPQDCRPVWAAIRAQEYVFQENIEQHPVLAGIMPDGLNTVRATTVQDSRGDPILASCRIKFGRAGRVGDVDHPLTLGAAIVDGRLAPYAITRWPAGGDTYTHHPDTGIRLGDVALPDWGEAIDMVLTAARHIDYPIVGWDVGFSTKGPILIEGNARPGLIGDEITAGVGYLSHPLVGSIIRDLVEASRADRPD